VHHINGNHKDNRIENLMLCTASEHRKLHPRPAELRVKTKKIKVKREKIMVSGYICRKCKGTFKAPQGSRKELCPECLFTTLSKEKTDKE